eukprot:m.404418 g.404418  ORF g.404418 m.404418 type:complete len:72 (+) comp16792_c0_seq8:1663-1878(+)
MLAQRHSESKMDTVRGRETARCQSTVDSPISLTQAATALLRGRSLKLPATFSRRLALDTVTPAPETLAFNP